MQILSVSADHYASNPNYLKQMHRLRAAVFGGRLEWDVTNTEHGERDQYDDFLPTYILAISAGQKVVGCARLLPASGPTMLEQTFPQLLERGSLDAHPAMVESSRFCVGTSLAAGRGGEGRGGEGQLHLATLNMSADNDTDRNVILVSLLDHRELLRFLPETAVLPADEISIFG